MHFIQTTKSYDKSYVKLLRSGIKEKVIEDIACVINTLEEGGALDAKYCDHKLQGGYAGYRECHIRADLLLVYQIQEKQLVLVLLDIRTHSYLFG